MTVEYDLVVIGASAAGIAAAKTAARYHARVALVQQGETYNTLPICLSLLQQTSLFQQTAPPQSAPTSSPAPNPQRPNFAEMAQLLQLLTQQQQAGNSFDGLAALGIDVITDVGAFYRKPRLGFSVGNRALSARAYLVAMSLNQLQDSDDWTPANFPQHLAELDDIQHLLIIGASPATVAIAQALAKLGLRVTLIDAADVILGQSEMIDPEVAGLLQAQLEADGVEIWTGCERPRIDRSAGKVVVQVNGQTITADALLTPAARQLDVAKLAPEQLNLGAAKVRWNQQRIFVDRCLRGSRKVYVCVLLDSPQHNRTSENQAIAATHHALRLPWGPQPSQLSPITVRTNPELVTIGLTEAQAKQRYGHRIYVLKQPLNRLLKAQVIDRTLGYCKVIVQTNGTIVGAHLLGAEAAEWSAVLTLAIQQQLSINTIADLVFPTPSLAEVLGHLAADYRVRVRQSNLWRYTLEEFFAWRRYWAK
ncbi:NAD(P)/FAD-dependent oxidoreductase [filamentous cyanobacterium LEGE 11480]|uniref:NAD(P)/FAD-dependent oxidoreductase n=1 Tax=Romeriopsis navalis LEGE 11480 TaxID=2777977 RepID=A0A928VVU2_9CYAN|nr:FAD-dependent oxidoreductase [Romeriopsis navalis]MBE9033412.1 NAD(P)/FAD-dependent oxidoreductase [Romeriopsis navalis LEGE 11480]